MKQYHQVPSQLLFTLLLLLSSAITIVLCHVCPNGNILSIPQRSPPRGSFHLTRQQELARKLLLWGYDNETHADSWFPLPDGPFGRSNEQSEYVILATRFSVEAAALGERIESTLESGLVLEEFDDYFSLYTLFPKPKAIQANITSDEYFGRERLTVFPHRLQQVTSLDDIPFDVTRIEGLDNSTDLNELIESGMLFIEDYTYLNFIPVRHGYFSAPATLFLIDKNDLLMPLAIYVPETDIVYSYTDDPNDWLLAKLLANAAAVFAQQGDHVMWTHSSMVTVRLALERNVANVHPLYPLLQHHLDYQYGIPPATINLLYQNGTVFDRIFAFGGEGGTDYLEYLKANYNFSEHYPDIDKERRGVGNIPDYTYMEDAESLFSAIHQFVLLYIKSYYCSNDDIINDRELNAWIQEASSLVTGFPSIIRTREELMRVVTQIIFLCTVQHHSSNTFVVYNYATVLPMHPLLFRQPLPTSKGEVDNIVDWLPDLETSLLQIRQAGVFEQLLEPSIQLGNAAFSLQTDVRHPIQYFYEELNRISQRIKTRTEPVFEYKILDPENVPYYSYV